jgi:Flp pilus assembly protein TadG
MRYLQRLRGLSLEEQGNSIIEFAVSATVLLTMMFGIMDASRALYADHYTSEMAR